MLLERKKFHCNVQTVFGAVNRFDRQSRGEWLQVKTPAVAKSHN